MSAVNVTQLCTEVPRLKCPSKINTSQVVKEGMDMGGQRKMWPAPGGITGFIACLS